LVDLKSWGDQPTYWSIPGSLISLLVGAKTSVIIINRIVAGISLYPSSSEAAAGKPRLVENELIAPISSMKKAFCWGR